MSEFLDSNMEHMEAPWAFKLFVAGETPAAARAVLNLKQLIEDHLPFGTKVQIVDLSREWDAEDGDAVLAVPLLMRKCPPPPRRIIGDLANTERVLRTLDLPVPG